MNLLFNSASHRLVVTSNDPKKQERLEVLDVIKAFALLGIFVLHVIGPFSGWAEYMLPDQKQLLPTAVFDVWINTGIHVLLAEKCRGAFSFLFGLAFYYQLQKAERQGAGFTGHFLKRLTFLFICGIFHAYLLFAGDVLRYYAICGLFLLLVYKWPPRRILVLGITLLTVLPATFIVLSHHFPYSNLNFEKWQEVRNGFMSNSYIDLIKVNFFLDWRSQLHVYYKLQFLSVVLGQFLLGLWAAKKKVFSLVPHYQAKFTSLFWVGLVIGILSFCITFSIDKVDFFRPYPELTEIADSFFFLVGNQALVLCYICGLTLLFQKISWRKYLLIIAPTGRMSLTNYLLQSVIGAVVFYGVGLGHFGRLGPTISIPLTVVLFGGQVFFSRYWLRRFELGPFEWLFRTVLQWNGQIKTHNTVVKPLT
jgi:uncharacterized protein